MITKQQLEENRMIREATGAHYTGPFRAMCGLLLEWLHRNVGTISVYTIGAEWDVYRKAIRRAAAA